MNYSSACSLFFCLLFFFFSVVSQEKNSINSQVVSRGNIIDYQAIEALCAQPAIAEYISYSSDSCLQKEEFLYLLGFKEGDEIDASDVLRAIELFTKKNKYSQITVEVIPGVSGICVSIHFESIWTCNKVKIHGIFQGKNSLLRHYLIEPGTAFDNEKHQHSLEKIREALIQEGYCNNWVGSDLEYDEKTKEVTVHIRVSKGKCFCFGSITSELSGDITDEECELLHKYVQKQLSRSLVAKQAKKELLNQHAVQLKRSLARKGFLHTSLVLEETIHTKRSRVDLRVKIVIHQKRTFVFLGNHFFSHKYLLNVILEFGRSVWLMPLSMLAQELARVYREKGFWKSEIVTQEKKDQSFFIIKEGERAIIKKVDIHHAHQIDQSYLVKHCFGRLLKRKVYDAQLYDEAIGLLYAAYAKKGFLYFQVVDHEYVSLEQDNEYALIITVDEKQQMNISSVSVEGYPELLNQGPFKKFLNDEDAPISVDAFMFEEQRAWLVSYFQQRGYLHPRVKPHIETQDGKTCVRWVIEPGELVRFGKAVVSGSTTFPFDYFLASLCYEPGQLWDQDTMRQTFLRLKDLEIFDTIHLVPSYEYKGEEKPIMVKIRPDDQYEIRARAGLELQHVRKYQTFSGVTYKIGGTALMKNPFNCGDQIRFDCDCAHSHKEIVGRYRRSLFLKVPLVALFQAYIISYQQPGFISSSYRQSSSLSNVNDIYMLKQRGFFAGIQRKTDKADCGIKAGFEWMSTSVKDELIAFEIARALNFEPRLLDIFIPFFFIEPALMVERLDNPFNPSRGTLTLLSFKALVPLKDKYQSSSFFKLLCEQSFFVPLGRAVGALRIRCGHIFRRELRATMPSERFYLGGSHSLRGYEADLAPPLGIFVNQEGEEQIVPRGGRSMFNLNIELRMPIVKAVGGVLFQDIGALSSDLFADFKPHNMLAATGFGVRFFSPLGPLRFDIGWRWRKQIPLERSFAWFLTFGHAF